MKLQIAITRDSYEMYISSCPRNHREHGIFMKMHACAEVVEERRRRRERKGKVASWQRDERGGSLSAGHPDRGLKHRPRPNGRVIPLLIAAAGDLI